MRDGLSDAFESGSAVTAKVLWLPQGRFEDDDPSRPTNRRVPGSHYTNISTGVGNVGESGSRTRYISCTPLLGSDDQVGVWVVVMVENEQVTGTLASREATWRRFGEAPPTPVEYDKDDDSWGGSKRGKRVDSAEPGMLYAEFLRSQYKGRAKAGSGMAESERERDGMMINGGREREGMTKTGREREGPMNGRNSPVNGGSERYGMINVEGERLGTMNGGGDRQGSINVGGERLGMMNGGGERHGTMTSSGGERLGTPNGGGSERFGIMSGGSGERLGIITTGGRERLGMMNGGRDREVTINSGSDRDGMIISEKERDGMMMMPMMGTAEGIGKEGRYL